jgi:hypothetical protein
MPYDSKLDQQHFTKTWQGGGSKLTVGVYSYNNGPKKVQITRELLTEEGKPGFTKLGRMTKEELAGVLPFLQEALGVL